LDKGGTFNGLLGTGNKKSDCDPVHGLCPLETPETCRRSKVAEDAKRALAKAAEYLFTDHFHKVSLVTDQRRGPTPHAKDFQLAKVLEDFALRQRTSGTVGMSSRDHSLKSIGTAILCGDPDLETCGNHLDFFSAACNILSGWWFGTFFIFPYIGNNDPN
jgi:hypothetical protein